MQPNRHKSTKRTNVQKFAKRTDSFSFLLSHFLYRPLDLKALQIHSNSPSLAGHHITRACDVEKILHDGVEHLQCCEDKMFPFLNRARLLGLQENHIDKGIMGADVTLTD